MSAADGGDPGFHVVGGVFSADEMGALGDALDSSIRDRSRAGARHLMSNPAVTALALERRMIAITRKFLRSSAVPYRATLFDKSSTRNWLVVWHQDTALPVRERRNAPGWSRWSVKAGVTYAHAPDTSLSRIVALRVHLDDSRADNGPLRVLPGTHRMGVISDEDVDRLSKEIKPVECLVPAGGVVAMRPLLLHASSKAESDVPRRVLHIEYADSLRLDGGVELTIA